MPWWWWWDRDSNQSLKAEQQRHDRKLREQRANEEIRRARSEQDARLKAQEHARQEQAKAAQRKYEQEKAEMAKRDRKERLAYFDGKASALQSTLARLQEEIKSAKGQSTAATEKAQLLLKEIQEDEGLQKEAMADFAKKLALARDTMQKGEDEIAAAIRKTGQQESNVGKFLVLAAQMSKATMATTAKSNKLEAQLATFGELVTRETRSKLAISTYFEEHEALKPFVPALKAAGYSNMESLKCDNDEELAEIVSILDKAAGEMGGTEEKEANEDQKDQEQKATESESVPDDPEQMLTKYKLGKFWAKLEEEGWDDPEEWADLTDDDLTEMGFKKGNINRFRKMLNKESPDEEEQGNLSKLQLRLIKGICRKPDTWQELEQAREAAARDSLAVLSDLLAKFFLRVDGGMKQAEVLLELGGATGQLSEPQMKAIEAANEQPSDEKVEFKEEESEARHAWQVGSEVEVFSKSKKEWCRGKVVQITEEAEEEWLHVDYDGAQKRVGRLSQWVRSPPFGLDVDPEVVEEVKPTPKDLVIARQSEALTNASIVSINVTDSMKEEFEANPTALRALTVASGVQDCCVGILRGQSALRQSLLMVDEIRSMKPADLTASSKALWDCMDEGAVSIMTTALKMTQVTAKYFGFFLKLRQSFQFYLANQQRPMVIACEYLIEDCQAFSKFNKEFTEFVAQLNEQAVKVIKECVETGIGIENFESAQKEREQNKQAFLEAQALYDKKLEEWRIKLDDKHQKRIKLEADKVELAFRLQTLAADEQAGQEQMAEYREQIKRIQSQ